MRQPSFAVFDEGLDSPDTATTSLSDISMRSQEDSFGNIGLEVSRIEEAFDEDDEGADADDINTKGLPSLGSADHEAGTCKRCNFFAKGRCQNDRNCKFCHLPHSKRKVSLQEKRERRAAWLLEQSKAVAGEAGKMSQADGCAEEQATAAGSKLPGSVPLVAGSATIPPYPCSLPPGLSPPRRSQQASCALSAAELISSTPADLAACDGQQSPEAPGVKQTSTISTQTSPQKLESVPASSGLRV